jgi:hypothetical protein
VFSGACCCSAAEAVVVAVEGMSFVKGELAVHACEAAGCAIQGVCRLAQRRGPLHRAAADSTPPLNTQAEPGPSQIIDQGEAARGSTMCNLGLSVRSMCTQLNPHLYPPFFTICIQHPVCTPYIGYLS